MAWGKRMKARLSGKWNLVLKQTEKECSRRNKKDCGSGKWNLVLKQAKKECLGWISEEKREGRNGGCGAATKSGFSPRIRKNQT